MIVPVNQLAPIILIWTVSAMFLMFCRLTPELWVGLMVLIVADPSIREILVLVALSTPAALVECKPMLSC